MTLSDRLTARALRLALVPGSAEDAARHLADLAGDRPRALEQALARLHRGVAERPSSVGRRAAASVEAALALVLVPALAS